MAEFYDTHAHLADRSFANELSDLVRRARQAGVSRIITIGTDVESSRRCVEIARESPNVYAVVGWHPAHALEAPDDIRPFLREMAELSEVVAFGETGLDYYWLPSKKEGFTAQDDARYKEKQTALFEQHLEVAAQTGLNCVVHTRDSFPEALAQVLPYKGRARCVFHCFAEDAARMRQVVDAGSLVSFTGILTFKNGQNIRDTLSATPDGSFMFETDSPYLAPVPFRGKRCEPAYVAETAKFAAAVRNCTVERLSQLSCATANSFFRFPAQ